MAKPIDITKPWKKQFFEVKNLNPWNGEIRDLESRKSDTTERFLRKAIDRPKRK